MTSSSEQGGHRPGPHPAHTSVVGPSRDLSGLPGNEKIAPGLETPPTASQLGNLGQKPAAGRLVWGRFIGRAEEMAALRAAIDASLGGQASLVMVVGEPGIGKTRLAEEARSYARLRGARVLVGQCYEGEAASPYSPFVEVIREYVATRPDDALRAELGDGASDVAKLVPEIHKRIPELPASPATDPREERMRLFDSVVAFLVKASKAHLLMLHLDDLHWADKPSLLLLQHLARRFQGSRLVVVGTYRDGELDRRHPLSVILTDLRHERLYERVLLHGLSESEVKDLIEAISQQEGTGAPGEKAFVRAILHETEGNPFFIEEVLRHLVESGALYRRDGRWVSDAKSLAEMGIPEGVRDVIGQRLSHLSEATNRTLAAGAVVGREFEFELLAPMTGLSEDQMIQAVEEALANQVLVETRGRLGPRYAFTHALVRQTLYEDLSLPRKQRLHLKAAQAIEAVHEHNLEPHVAALANHYQMAGIAADAEKSIDYSIRAGRAAFGVFAYEEAGAHWRAALRLMDEQGGGDRKRRAELLWLLGIEFVSSGAEAIEYLENAAPLFEELGDNKAAVDVHLRLTTYLATNNVHAMDMRRATPHFEKTEALLAGQPESLGQAQFYLNLAGARRWAQRIGDGVAAGKRAMEITERQGSDLWWSIAAVVLSNLLIDSGRVAEGLFLADQARRRAEPIVAPDVAWSGGCNPQLLGNPREAQDWYASELAKPHTTQAAISHARLLHALVASFIQMGELDKARSYLAEAKAHDKPPLLLLFEGEGKLAAKRLIARRERLRATGNLQEELWVSLDLARVHRLTGEHAQAVQVLQWALKISVDGGNILYELATRSTLTTLAACAGDAGQALPHLERCREIVGAGENWFGLAGYVQRAEAVVAAAQGEYSVAEAHFEKAIATFQRYCLPWEEADTLQYWGRALVAAGERARANERFDAAIDVYRSHGAGTRFVEYVIADRMRAQGSNSTDAEEQSPSADSVRANAPALTHQLRTPTSNDSSPGDSGVVNVFRREGEFWTLAYRGATFHLKDVKGLGYIAFLLAHPGDRIHVHELISRVDGVPASGSQASGTIPRETSTADELGDAGSVLDRRAQSDYRQRLRELAEEITEAERNNDIGRAETIRNEQEFLTGELSAAFGIGGRERKVAAQVERVRSMVSKRIRASMEKIRNENAILGRYLAASIKTGYYCAYLPDPERKVSWQL